MVAGPVGLVREAERLEPGGLLRGPETAESPDHLRARPRGRGLGRSGGCRVGGHGVPVGEAVGVGHDLQGGAMADVQAAPGQVRPQASGHRLGVGDHGKSSPVDESQRLPYCRRPGEGSMAFAQPDGLFTVPEGAGGRPVPPFRSLYGRGRPSDQGIRSVSPGRSVARCASKVARRVPCARTRCTR